MKKKLVFNKTTISNLSNRELNQLRGGVETDYPCLSEDICLSVDICPTINTPMCEETIKCPTVP